MKVWVVWKGFEPDVFLDGIYSNEASAEARADELCKGCPAWSAEVEVKS